MKNALKFLDIKCIVIIEMTYDTEEERQQAKREALNRKMRKYYQNSAKYREYKKQYTLKKKQEKIAPIVIV